MTRLPPNLAVSPSSSQLSIPSALPHASGQNDTNQPHEPTNERQAQQRANAASSRAGFLYWLCLSGAGSTCSVHKLDAPAPLNLNSLDAASAEEIKQIQNHLGASTLDEVKRRILYGNEMIRLVHYGKRAQPGEVTSEHLRLLDKTELKSDLNISKKLQDKLNELCQVFHINVGISVDESSAKKTVPIYFEGADRGWTDTCHLAGVALNFQSPWDSKMEELSEWVKSMMESNPDVEFQSIGHSAGAAVARVVTTKLDLPGAVLFDPQLITDVEADIATKGKDKEATLKEPRGLALTVYSGDVGGLTDNMKYYNFSDPGVLQIRMQLKDSDGNGYKKTRDNNGEEIWVPVTELPHQGKFGHHGRKNDMLLLNLPTQRLYGDYRP